MKCSNKLVSATLFLFSLALASIALLDSCEGQPFRQGEILYQNFCSNCHMDDGSGLAGNIPPLAGSSFLQQNQEMVPCLIRNGQQGPIEVNGKTYNNPMAPIPQLSDIEITNIINYINHSWGNDFGFVQFEPVRQMLKRCPNSQAQ
ncbi:MAG: cytochrome c [Phaeodactylibacter sp.]|nr:cytochrome c [Phaeodactylibacter sp.]MCB9277028.1 cytochrome c [Lewinellaceae bacterium]